MSDERAQTGPAHSGAEHGDAAGGRAPSHIHVRGAREHNLANIDVAIPREQLVVVCGVSGSGKSTLAFDTVYAEGQRRYVESLSAYARQFLGQVRKPDVDGIDGLSPAVAIDQKTTSANPRSTVGTVTEIHDHLRLLWARAGEAHCPDDGTLLGANDLSGVVARVSARVGEKVMIGASVATAKKGTMRAELDALVKAGYTRARVDGRIVRLDEATGELDRNLRHDVEVIVDRFEIKGESRLRISQGLEAALRAGNGEAFVEVLDGETVRERELCSLTGACGTCGKSWPAIEPRTFSFNSPFGACQTCDGLGVQYRGVEALIVPDATRSIREGAIAPWQGWYGGYHRWVLDALSRAKGVDLDVAWADLDARSKRLVLDGYDGVLHAKHQGKRYELRYEGVTPWLAKRFAEAKTDRHREQAEQYMREVACGTCHGARLAPYPLAVRVGGASIAEVAAMTVADAREWFEALELEGARARIAERVVREARERLRFLVDVGLGYITLDRSAKSLSGGEAQRIRLASQVGAGLAGVLYVLDEPSIGLHPRDNRRLIGTLERLRDLGNTVLVVEHDEETIRAADWVIDVGPGAGVHGGRIVAEGPVEVIEACAESLTGQYLSRAVSIATPQQRRSARAWLTVRGAKENNLQDVDASFPIGCLTTVCGVSGSGKSTLVSDVLEPALSRALHGAKRIAGAHERIDGLEALDKVISIDQTPIGRTPRSNPATYTGVFDKIRTLFGELPDAKVRGWKPGRFSFNVPVSSGGGRCEACEGDGTLRIEMNFLPDVYVPCERCEGRRYSDDTLEVRFKGHSIADVLEMTVEDARVVFSAQPAIKRVLDVLWDVGLGYVKLGQSATQLSGGEAQRVKLASELCRRQTGKTVYLLDEPTTGLHFADVAKLVEVLQRLVDAGNTVIVIEHNVDVARASDWLVELGPEGGRGGGLIIAEGSPEDVAEGASATAEFVAESLLQHGTALPAEPGAARPGAKTPVKNAAKSSGKNSGKTVAKKAPAKKTAVKKAPVKKAPVKKAPAKKRAGA